MVATSCAAFLVVEVDLVVTGGRVVGTDFGFVVVFAVADVFVHFFIGVLVTDFKFADEEFLPEVNVVRIDFVEVLSFLPEVKVVMLYAVTFLARIELED